MSTHTPGPWNVTVDENQRYPVTVFSVGDDYICHMESQNPNAAQNTKLVASAPELFDALETLQIATLGYVFRPPTVQVAHKLAEAALCKARGTSVTGMRLDEFRTKRESLIDMLTNLMHANPGFDSALDMARVHYNEETNRGGQ